MAQRFRDTRGQTATWKLLVLALMYGAMVGAFLSFATLAMLPGLLLAWIGGPRMCGGLPRRQVIVASTFNTAVWVGGVACIAARVSPPLWEHATKFWSAIAGLAIVALAFAQLARIPPRKRKEGLCTKCGYDLAGLPRPSVCPECGTPFR